MTIQLYELHLICDNPYQPRTDPGDVAGLAADIAAHGLLQPAVGRVCPDRPEYVQLAAGHRRLAAVRQLRQAVFDRLGPNTTDSTWAAFPVDVRELTDLQLATVAIAENSARKDLSAIEKAQALQRLITEFHLSQAQAGEPFGLSQSGVANLLRLLKLPEPVQAHVASGAVPERLARQLVTVGKVFPDQVGQIAAEVAQVESASAKEAKLDEAMRKLMNDKGKWFHSVPWALDWPKKPIKLEGHKSLSAIPACAGCEFYVKREYGSAACLRAECFDAKWALAVADQVAAAAKKLGLAVLAAGEKVELAWGGKNGQPDQAKRLLATQHASLRLGAYNGEGYSWTRKDALGCADAALYTIDAAGLRKALAALPADKKKATSSADNWQKRYEAQRKAEQERSKRVHALYAAAAPTLAAALPLSDGAIEFLYRGIGGYAGDEAWKAARQPAQRRELFVRELLDNRRRFGWMDRQAEAEARELVAAAAKAFKAKLPRGWDKPPAPPTNGAKAKPAAKAAKTPVPQRRSRGGETTKTKRKGGRR